jgi:predicted CXXCH cytochrome family protein
VIRGDGAVPRQQCRSCHNREDDLAKFDDDVFMHKIHVTDHKVDCSHCHLEIEHALDEQKLAHSAANCAACHSDPHAAQVEMFQGVGARTVPAHPGGMTVTRIDCRSCHSVLKQLENGAGLREASADMCQKCHESFPAEEVETYLTEVNAAMAQLQASLDRIRDRLQEEPESVSPQRREEIRADLVDMQADLDFLAKANAIHNSHYATTLTEELLERLVRYSNELGIAEPEVTLPSIEPGE